MPHEKMLGISTVFYNGTTWAFKVLKSENGGYFVKPGSHKVLNPETNAEEYINSFTIDSNMEYKKLEQFVHQQTGIKLENINYTV